MRFQNQSPNNFKKENKYEIVILIKIKFFAFLKDKLVSIKK